jgi:hypothetical protein
VFLLARTLHLVFSAVHAQSADFHAHGRIVHRAWPGCPRSWGGLCRGCPPSGSERVSGLAAVGPRPPAVRPWHLVWVPRSPQLARPSRLERGNIRPSLTSWVSRLITHSRRPGSRSLVVDRTVYRARYPIDKTDSHMRTSKGRSLHGAVPFRRRAERSRPIRWSDARRPLVARSASFGGASEPDRARRRAHRHRRCDGDTCETATSTTGGWR